MGREGGRERELTRHEVSQPETGGGEPSTDGNQGSVSTASFYLSGLQEKTAEIWLFCPGGQRKVAKTGA